MGTKIGEKSKYSLFAVSFWIYRQKEKQGYTPLLFLLKTKQLITRLTLYLLKTNQSIKYVKRDFAKYCTQSTHFRRKLFHKNSI